MESSLKRDVVRSFTKHFRETGDHASSWNLTLEEVAGPYSESTAERRDAVAKILHVEGKKLARWLGRMMGKVKKTYEVRSLDVWGNARDGWEVNQAFNAGTIEIFPDDSDADVLKELRAAGLLSEASRGAVVIEWSDENYADVNERLNGRPLFQLSAV